MYEKGNLETTRDWGGNFDLKFERQVYNALDNGGVEGEE